MLPVTLAAVAFCVPNFTFALTSKFCPVSTVAVPPTNTPSDGCALGATANTGAVAGKVPGVPASMKLTPRFATPNRSRVSSPSSISERPPWIVISGTCPMTCRSRPSSTVITGGMLTFSLAYKDFPSRENVMPCTPVVARAPACSKPPSSKRICVMPFSVKTTANRLPSRLAATNEIVPAPSVLGPATIAPLASKTPISPLASLAATSIFVRPPVRAIAPTPTPFGKSDGAAGIKFVSLLAKGSQSARRASVDSGWRKRTASFPLDNARTSTGLSKITFRVGEIPSIA